jgi:AraC-like DNA-binding protein
MKPYKEKVIYQEASSFLSFRRTSPNYEFSWHIHPEFEIVYMIAGYGTRYIGNSVQAYTSPELVFIPPGVPHSWQSAVDSKTNDAYVIHFKEDCFGKEWYNQRDFQQIQELLTSGNTYLETGENTVREIFEDLIKSDGLQRVATFIRMFDYLCNANLQIIPDTFNGNVDSHKDKRFEKAIAYIQKNFRSELSVESTAKALSMSTYQLRSLFKTHTKKNVLTYINELKVFEVCRLMQSKEYTISYLSLQAGFQNLSYFNRIFLKVTGMTPRDYRKTFC